MKHLITALLIAPLSVLAEDGETDPGGTLNPDEMSLSQSLAKAASGEVDMVVCSHGYLLTKRGRHEDARTIFKNCAAAGWTGTMTWMAYMEDNAFGGDYDPVAAAQWDRNAAEAGDPIGMFNYGLDLLRGHGVIQDLELGRSWIDKAADMGLEVAETLRRAEYDVDTVTPDADNWKYAPPDSID